MRLATANTFDTSIATLQRRQQQLQTSQQQLTSGKKVSKASDDPTGAARAERAQTAISKIDANQRALEASRNSMTLSESALGDANEMLQQVRETMVAAGNASYSDTERAGLADKIAGLRAQMLSIANRPDGAGGYLFAGQGSAAAPFLDQADGVSFNGVSGANSTGSGESFALTVDGRQGWEQARSGNGSFVTGPDASAATPPKGWIDAGTVTDPAQLTGKPYEILISGTAPAAQSWTITNTVSGTSATGAFQSGKTIAFEGMAMSVSGSPVAGDKFTVEPATSTLKVFDVLDRLINQLRTPMRGGAAIAQANNSGLRDLDAVMGKLESLRSQVGEAMTNLDGSESRMAAQKQYSQSEKSAAEDLDMVSGISNFQNQQTGYDTALKTYAMVQRMSLFQYISA
jgi:flagellar hook-associated protein 3 FlgL